MRYGVFLAVGLALGLLGGAGVSAHSPLAEPYPHAPGDWFSVHVVDPSGRAHEGTLVVVDVGERLVVGTPDAELLAPLLTESFPGIGVLDALTLSASFGGLTFQPLLFPLEVGRAWPVVLDGAEARATVVAVEDLLVTVEYRGGPGERLVATIVYDAGMGFVRTMSGEDRATVRVTAWGSGASCSVIVPRSPAVLMSEHRSWRGSYNTPASARAEVIEVVSERLHSALLVTVEGKTGTHSREVLAPDGRVFKEVVTMADKQRNRALYALAGQPSGHWALGGAGTGSGSALVHVVGFDGTDHEVHVAPAEGDGFAPGCADPIAPPTALVQAAPVPAGGAESGLPPLAWGVGMLAGLALLRPLRRLAGLPLLGLYAKIPPERVLEHPSRQAIVDLLHSDPGLTTQEIRERIELAWSTTVHHLAALERADFIVSVPWGRQRDWYLAREWKPLDMRARSAMKREAPRSVLRAILDAPGRSPRELSRALGISHSTVLFHAHRLEKAGLVEISRGGQRVRFFPAPDCVGRRLPG